MVKIGFIGAGRIAQSHIKGLKLLPNAQVVSVYDANRDTAIKFAEECGAQVMNSADEVLDNKRIDAVYICTPQFAREELEETAVSRGIHLFVEKPLGLEHEIVQKKADIISKSGLINAAGYCLRYYDTLQEAKQYLQGKHVHLIQAHRFGTAHSSKWWWQLEKSGGHLVDAVTHQIDLIRFLVGEFHNVHSQFGNSSLAQTNQEATIYDAGAITFTLNSGAVGSVTESCVSPFHAGSEIKLFGADFFIHIVSNKMVTITDRNQQITRTSKLNVMYEEDRVFVDAVESGNQNLILSSYADGAKTLAFTLAANRSAEEKRVITL
jgi:predicted dehydrogenase